jgi:hypothetical protein
MGARWIRAGARSRLPSRQATGVLLCIDGVEAACEYTKSRFVGVVSLRASFRFPRGVSAPSRRVRMNQSSMYQSISRAMGRNDTISRQARTKQSAIIRKKSRAVR